MRLRNIWVKMRQRCNNPECDQYLEGIAVCEEWDDAGLNRWDAGTGFPAFKEWALLNGYSKDLILVRKDETGDFTPDNCEWVTRQEKALREGRTRFLEIAGISHTFVEWSEISGVSVKAIKRRLYLGWTGDMILAPLRERQKRESI